MILQTGGLAFGATSTRSRSASAATRSASSMRTMPTCSPPGPINRTSGTRMRSLTRVSVLMGPPLLGFCGSRIAASAVENHTNSKKALHKQGPMPTDRGLELCQAPALPAEQASTMPVTGPLNLEKFSWPAVGVGLHLLSPAFTGMVAVDSLAAM